MVIYLLHFISHIPTLPLGHHFVSSYGLHPLDLVQLESNVPLSFVTEMVDAVLQLISLGAVS